jgi:hypothetical protein
MDVYFDTNVYSHIFKRNKLTDADIRKLERAVENADVRVFTSFPVIEETNAARLTALDEANERLELIRTFAVQDKIIKTHNEIIRGDIDAYANGTPPPSKFQAPYPRLRDIFWDHTANYYKTLDGYARDTIDEVTTFKKDLDDSFEKFIRPLVEDERNKNEPQQPFADYWNAISEAWAEQMADKHGRLKECKAKGLNGLLNIHSLRVYVGAHLSLCYANSYEVKRFNRGNSRDMHHVVCSSAVPIFVTHDERLTKLLLRMPAPGLEVTTLQSLLKRL